jgi:branched-subunit amino acid permease
MPAQTHRPSFVVRAIGWITTPILYVLLIRIVISAIRHPPAYYH